MSGRVICNAGSAAVVALLCTVGDVRAQQLDHDTSLPIEITADTLEVVQPDQVATFEGNVDAVQGDLTLSADRLRVHYRGSGDAADESAAGSTGTIRRIEAFGNVVVTSPMETAQGATGVYDVASRQVTLDGQVVLTRAQNVITGEHLVLDLNTGVSRMIAGGTASEGAPPEERVRAIFTPQDGGDDQPPQDRPGSAPEAAAPPAASSGPAGGLPVPTRKPADG